MDKQINRIDLAGFAILRTLTPDSLLERYQELLAGVTTRSDAPPRFEFIQYDPEAFTWILGEPSVIRLVETFCGWGARLDNHFGTAAPEIGATVNGGPCSEGGAFYYHRQGAHRQTSALYAGIVMQEHRGLFFVPGSHLSDPRPEWSSDHFDVYKPHLLPGDIVVFTGAVVHGTVRVHTPCQVLYYMFTPGHVAWAKYQEPAWLSLVPVTRQRFFTYPGMMSRRYPDLYMGEDS